MKGRTNVGIIRFVRLNYIKCKHFANIGYPKMLLPKFLTASSCIFGKTCE